MAIGTMMLAAAQLGAAPDLGWLAGYWLSCADGVEISETWSDPRGGVLLGTSLTSGRSTGWELIRIEAEEGAVRFHALPRGQAPASFALIRSAPGVAVFENPDHDFPQRVIYRREGDRLTGRIEGRSLGQARSFEWVYRRAPLNARCPAGGSR